MTVYKVVGVTKKKDLPDGKYGPSVVYSLELEGPEGRVEADLVQKQATPAPAQGGRVEGDVQDTEYGKSFKKAPPAFGVAGPRGKSPEEQGEIRRAVALKAAVETCAIKPESLTTDTVLAISRKYEAYLRGGS